MLWGGSVPKRNVFKDNEFHSFIYVAPGPLSLPSSRRSTGASLWITGLMYSVRLFITMVGKVLAICTASLTWRNNGFGPVLVTENTIASGFPRCSGCSFEICCDMLLVSEFLQISARCWQTLVWAPEARLTSVDIATNNTRPCIISTSSWVACSLLWDVASREKTPRQVGWGDESSEGSAGPFLHFQLSWS